MSKTGRTKKEAPSEPPGSPPRGVNRGGWDVVAVFAIVALLLALVIVITGSVNELPTIVSAAVLFIVLLGIHRWGRH